MKDTYLLIVLYVFSDYHDFDIKKNTVKWLQYLIEIGNFLTMSYRSETRHIKRAVMSLKEVSK